MHKVEPRKYSKLVNSLKHGSFDKVKLSDTEAISPDEWFSHFSSLLGQPHCDNEADKKFEEYFQQNIDQLASDMDQPFKKKNVLRLSKNLKITKLLPLTKFIMILITLGV